MASNLFIQQLLFVDWQLENLFLYPILYIKICVVKTNLKGEFFSGVGEEGQTWKSKTERKKERKKENKENKLSK